MHRLCCTCTHYAHVHVLPAMTHPDLVSRPIVHFIARQHPPFARYFLPPSSFELKDAEPSAAARKAPTPAPGGAKLSEEEVASGRCWSARVVLVGGVNPAHLQVRVSDSGGRLGLRMLNLLALICFPHNCAHPSALLLYSVANDRTNAKLVRRRGRRRARCGRIQPRRSTLLSSNTVRPKKQGSMKHTLDKHGSWSGTKPSCCKMIYKLLQEVQYQCNCCMAVCCIAHYLNCALSRCCCLIPRGADKREYGMVGGAWDPQDGGHPASDPAALTRTAIRHFKAATGVDLSKCTQVGQVHFL